MVFEVEAFRVAVPQTEVEDLQRRLENSRFSDTLTEDGDTWEYGISGTRLRSLAEQWKTSFDWRKQESMLNSKPMFRANVLGTKVHFVHVRSPRADARPLILTHGWPGSFFEFYKCIDALTAPADNRVPAFHVVTPSLPGFGFSENPKHVESLTVAYIAELFVGLMNGLGYSQFFAQGGDWGSMVTKAMAILFPKNCVAIHLNLAFAPLPQSLSYTFKRWLYRLNPSLVLTDREIAGEEFSKHFWSKESGYYKAQGTKPYSTGVGMNDSPIGLLAWIAEKFRFSEGIGDEDILTNVSIYWFTRSIVSSFRIYKDNFEAFRLDVTPEYIGIPTGVAVFYDIFHPPEEWLRYVCNLQHYSVMPRGGHFAALEEPELFVEDVRKCFARQKIAPAAKL